MPNPFCPDMPQCETPRDIAWFTGSSSPTSPNHSVRSRTAPNPFCRPDSLPPRANSTRGTVSPEVWAIPSAHHSVCHSCGAGGISPAVFQVLGAQRATISQQAASIDALEARIAELASGSGTGESLSSETYWSERYRELSAAAGAVSIAWSDKKDLTKVPGAVAGLESVLARHQLDTYSSVAAWQT